ncbi:uncharacterized protein LOC122576930 [Bombus pyrosoma]|uniref:uncharacterized protein LOC122576930 n=1 Tax=Bombus pyrosoma TaxID=396416 RepID=UPI001CB9A9FC|nr:uncharacterized protein LOC122576930 [Bombus pyrosoma]XP_043603781.1 uncharacterized protein LOC122576930 [Bombus pyrosoma]
MDAEVSSTSDVPVRAVQRKGKRKRRKRYVNSSRKRGRRGGVERSERRLKKLKELLSTQVGTAAPSSASCPDNYPIADPTPSDKDIVEPSPSSPPFEVLDTDNRAKIRPPEDAPAEIPEAHMRHHSSGQGQLPCRWFLHPATRTFCSAKVEFIISFKSK